MTENRHTATRTDLITWFVCAVVLFLVIWLHLVEALIAGLLVYELVDVLTPWMRSRAVNAIRGDLVINRLGRNGPRVLAVTLIAAAVIAALTFAGIGIVAFLRSDDSLPRLMQRMAEILDEARAHLPASLLAYIPPDAETLRHTLTDWLRQHADMLQLAGRDVGRALLHILMGMIIGALFALQKAVLPVDRQPLAALITHQAGQVALAFRRVVFAQFWISLINTVFTWIYLGVVLPALGYDLPLTTTLVVITFVAGLVPIIGNLISNTMIAVVSLSKGLPVAVGSLAYLIIIHKLEYFLNARIIGATIKARAGELLIAMLVMESAFGIPGLIVTPIFYAYFKEELRSRALI
jgi:predicted PurR-regulated permease PerM